MIRYVLGKWLVVRMLVMCSVMRDEGCESVILECIFSAMLLCICVHMCKIRNLNLEAFSSICNAIILECFLRSIRKLEYKKKCHIYPHAADKERYRGILEYWELKFDPETKKLYVRRLQSSMELVARESN